MSLNENDTIERPDAPEQSDTVACQIERMRTLEVVRGVLYDCPELNHSNYDHDDVCLLDTAACEAWSIIEADA